MPTSDSFYFTNSPSFLSLASGVDNYENPLLISRFHVMSTKTSNCRIVSNSHLDIYLFREIVDLALI